MRAAGMLFLAALFGGLLAGGYLFYSATRDLPTLEAFENLRLTATSTLYARDGTPIATIASVEDGRAVNRTLVRLSDVSPAAISAVVFSEDKRFYEHYGVDPVRLVGALYYIAKGDLQGGSTITTQVVKQTLLRELANERALERKLKEFPLALELERRYSKQEILEMYLNVVPWGGNAQGIQAAAEAYFGKDPAALTLAEGVYLAQLIPGPNPRYFDLKSSRARMKRQLEDMVAEGWISQAQADAAWKQPLIPNGWQAKYDGTGNLLWAKLVDPSARVLPELVKNYAPHFVLAVRAELEKRFGKEKLYGEGGLQVYTSLDLKMQEAAERAVTGARLPVGAQLALAALDPQTGQVLAMVGEKPGTGGQFNRATQAWRSPGSAIKPFVYGTALENGWTQATTVPDAPVEFRDPSQPGGIWRPKNFSGRFLNRPVTIRYALDQSLNLPAIRTADAVGVWKIGEKLKTAGFRLAGNANLSNAIGGGAEITPVGLAGAYAAFVNGGYRVEPVLITRVEDAAGRVIYQPEDNRTLLFTPQVAYLVWDMLKGYVYDLGSRSLAPVAIPGRVVGGKTGTTNDATDLWFAGASRGLVAALWIGRDDHKPQRLPNGREPSSSLVNPPIWRAFMEEALRGRPGGDFPQPSGLVARRIDLISGNPSPSGIPVLFAQEPIRNREAAATSSLPASPSGYSAPAVPAASQTVALDRLTGCLAGPDTPPDRMIYRQVAPERVDSYRCP